jgi:hypothetical protein
MLKLPEISPHHALKVGAGMSGNPVPPAPSRRQEVSRIFILAEDGGPSPFRFFAKKYANVTDGKA